MAAEAPAPAATPSLEDEVYDALKTTIGQAFEQSDNNTACLAVHKAMAKAMADVVTDHKIREEGEIDVDQNFIEEWALTQLLMKDKLDHFMRMRIHATNAAGATLVIKENVPYKAPDIETSIKSVGRSAKQEKQSQALNRLKVVYGLLAYKLAHEKPAIKAGIEQVIAGMEDLDKSDDPRKKYTLAGMQAEKDDYDKQLTVLQDGCLLLLLEEEDLLSKLEAGAVKPTIDSVDQIDDHKNTYDKLRVSEADLDALRALYDEKKDELKKSNSKKGKRKSVGQGSGVKGRKKKADKGDEVVYQIKKDKTVVAKVKSYTKGYEKPYVITYTEDGKEKEVMVAATKITKKGEEPEAKKQKTAE